MIKAILVIAIVLILVEKTYAQKGEKSIAGGLLVSFPETRNLDFGRWNTGVGLEAIGQYNFTNKSAALLQLQLTRFGGEELIPYSTNFDTRLTSFTSLSLKAGYRYQFAASGFYANALFGIELHELYNPAAIGIGKRFSVKEEKFLDVGVEYTGGYLTRYNVRAVFSLFNSKW